MRDKLWLERLKGTERCERFVKIAVGALIFFLNS